mmetsp:Transcript_29851/g.97684  ORF Transcript_29851/g.97684 Transcript_29851/m.97684 type:complete len:409 (+) Transcript_29851:26-1252(+)
MSEPHDEGRSGSDSDEESEADMLRRLYGLVLEEDGKGATREPLLTSFDVAGVADLIKSGKARQILVMSGAGVSTSAGIPDFRSPGSGLYHNLEQYGLPEPEAIFSIQFFRKNPHPFVHLAKQLYPGTFCPTPTHAFIRLLHEKGLLLRNFTQNIDMLERLAGVPGEKLVEAHGTFHSAHCIDCHTEHPASMVREAIFASQVPTCPRCSGTIKPDIVFFGEQLPDRFARLAKEDSARADLLLIMGTSLKVYPFAGLMTMVTDDCPRVLINREDAGLMADPRSLEGVMQRVQGFQGLAYKAADNYRDAGLLGSCDDIVRELADHLGWREELEEIVKELRSKFDEERAAAAGADDGEGGSEGKEDSEAKSGEAGAKESAVAAAVAVAGGSAAAEGAAPPPVAADATADLGK